MAAPRYDMWKWFVCTFFHPDCGVYYTYCDRERRQQMALAKPIELPPQLQFNWQRDYGPLWEPGSTAFWLAPESDDIEAGKWPLPFTEERPRKTEGLSGTAHEYYDEDGNPIYRVEWFVGTVPLIPDCVPRLRLRSVQCQTDYHSSRTRLKVRPRR
jgi:hypothetical protein